MKTYIRTLWFETVWEKDQRREGLNALGFYCLSIGYNGLEVYALASRENWFDNAVESIIGFLKSKLSGE